MIYLIDRRIIVEGVLDILVNQVKCPEGYRKCLCLGGKARGKLEVNQGSCFADGNDNDNDNDNGNGSGNDNNNNDEKGNQGTCFADGNGKQDSPLLDGVASAKPFHGWSEAHDDGDIIFSRTKQRIKPCSQCGCGCGCVGTLKASRLGASVNSKGNLLINVNGSLQ